VLLCYRGIFDLHHPLPGFSSADYIGCLVCLRHFILFLI